MGQWETIGASDEWYTPRYIFDALDILFDLDVASPPEGPRHVPAAKWISQDSLEAEWTGRVWMNPPFGGRNALSPWLEKFFDHGDGIALVPDRTSAPWWQEYAPRAELWLFMPKVRFERPDGSVGASPANGTVLLASGEVASWALSKSRLGVLSRPVHMKKG